MLATRGALLAVAMRRFQGVCNPLERGEDEVLFKSFLVAAVVGTLEGGFLALVITIMEASIPE